MHRPGGLPEITYTGGSVHGQSACKFARQAFAAAATWRCSAGCLMASLCEYTEYTQAALLVFERPPALF